MPLDLYQRLASNSRPQELTPEPSQSSGNVVFRPGDIPTSSYLTASAYATPRVDSDDVARPSHRVGRIARRVHGWSWQAFPVGMGTGAVYVLLGSR